MPFTATTRDIIHYIFLLSRYIKHTDLFKDKANSLSFLHFISLNYVAHKRKVTMKGMADWLKITPSSTTSLINSLAKKDLIERKTDAKDRRVVYLALTPKGRNALKRILKARNERIGATIARLKLKDQEMLL